MARFSLDQVKRRAPSIDPKLRIVLVCEGEKTERLYFSLFTEDLKAANIRLQVAPRDCGSDPLSVVRFGERLVEEDTGIDACFCIIDRDSHKTFSAALGAAKHVAEKVAPQQRFRVIVSVPCFEYWLLLHYTPSRAGFAAEKKKSAADKTKDALKKYLPNYAKNDVGPMASTFDKINEALKNSRLNYADAKATNEFNPSTQVHVLVNYLQLQAAGKWTAKLDHTVWGDQDYIPQAES